MRSACFIGIVWMLLGMDVSFGQHRQLDSLKALLATYEDARSLADIRLQMAFALYDQNVAAGFEQSTLAYELSLEGAYPKGEKLALSLIGFKYYFDGDHARAMEYFRQSDAIAARYDSVATGYNWTLMGNVYRVKTRYDSAEYFYNRAIGILSAAHDKVFLSYAYKNIGVIRQTQYKLKEAADYFEKTRKLREQANDKRGLVDSDLTLGNLEMSRSNYMAANQYFDRACDLIGKEFQGNIGLMVQCYINDGLVHHRLGDFELSLKLLFKALDLLKDQNFTYLYAKTSADIGELYADLAQFDLSLTYYFEALRNFEKLKAQKEISDALSGIAWVYKGQLNFPLALDFLKRSQEIRTVIHDQHGLSNCNNVRGLILFQQKKYDEALKELERALVIRKELNYTKGVADVTYNMALVFEEQGDFKKALEYQIRSMEMEREFGSDQGMGISYNGIGELLIRMGDYKKAEEYLRKGEESAGRTKSKLLLRDNYLFFSQLYEKQGEFEKSLHYRKLYDQVKDSVFVMNNDTKIAEMQALYQVEQKNKEIASQETQLTLKEEQLQKKNTVIISITIGIALTTLMAYMTYRYSRQMRRASHAILEQKEEIQAQSEELIEANETIVQINKNLESKVDERTLALKQAYKELDTFFYRSSHDFRRPLTTFLGLAEVAKVTVKDNNALELFDMVRDTALNLDRMLIKLQSISDLGVQQLVYKEVFIKELLDQVIEAFNDVIIAKNIQVTVTAASDLSFYSYPAMVKIIVENLVENAIHFCGVDDPYIRINVFMRHAELVIEVKDNGQGIKEEFFERIFDMYFRANQNSKGNGLGLYIAKKAAERLNGRIEFESVLGRGSSFEVVLPSVQM